MGNNKGITSNLPTTDNIIWRRPHYFSFILPFSSLFLIFSFNHLPESVIWSHFFSSFSSWETEAASSASRLLRSGRTINQDSICNNKAWPHRRPPFSFRIKEHFYYYHQKRRIIIMIFLFPSWRSVCELLLNCSCKDGKPHFSHLSCLFRFSFNFIIKNYTSHLILICIQGDFIC